MTASAETPAAVVEAYIDAFNRADLAAMAACWAEQGVILDGMAPHLWTGPEAAADWYRDVLTEGDHLDARDYHVSLGEPAHDVTTGDSAYLVVPAKMEFTLRGRPITQTGATITFALRRDEGGWRISAWAWAKGSVA